MKAVVAAFNQEKALVGAFSVITNVRICFGWNFLTVYSPGEVGQHLVDGAVGDVLVDAVAGLAQGEGELVTHPQQLPEADYLAHDAMNTTHSHFILAPCPPV